MQRTDVDLSDNLTFIHEDAARGLSFPDGYFDVIHARCLVAGVSVPSALQAETCLTPFQDKELALPGPGSRSSPAAWRPDSFRRGPIPLVAHWSSRRPPAARRSWLHQIRGLFDSVSQRASAGPEYLIRSLCRAADARGYDRDAANKNIAKYLTETATFHDVKQVDTFLPLWAWHEGEYGRVSGYQLNDRRAAHEESWVRRPKYASAYLTLISHRTIER